MIQLVVMTPNDLAVTIAVGVPCDTKGNNIRNTDGTAFGFAADEGGVISMDSAINGFTVGSVVVSATGYQSQIVMPGMGLTPVILKPARSSISSGVNTGVVVNPALQNGAGSSTTKTNMTIANVDTTQAPTSSPTAAVAEEQKKTFWEAHEHYIKLGLVLLIVGLGVAFIKDKIFK